MVDSEGFAKCTHSSTSLRCSRLSSADDVEAVELWQDGSDVHAVVVQSAGVVRLLEGLVGFAAAHVPGHIRKKAVTTAARVSRALTYVLLTVGNKLMSLR